MFVFNLSVFFAVAQLISTLMVEIDVITMEMMAL